MSIRNRIERALQFNNVLEDDIVVIKTDTTTTFLVHLFRLLVLLLCQFFLIEEMNEDEQYNFIMKNFNTIVEIVITELEIALLSFSNLYEEEITDMVELHNKDECLLLVAIQDRVNEKLEEIM